MTMEAAPGEDAAQPAFEPRRLRRATLNDEVYRELRRAIMAGAIQPGQTMTIRSLAASFGVSLMPVREALGRLVAEHVLELLPNRSVAAPVLHRARFREITRIRVALEGLAAEEGTAHIDEDEIRRMAELNGRMEDVAATATPGALEDNRRFHFALYRSSRMPTLVALIESLWLQIGPLLSFHMRDLALAPQPVLAHHREALAALAQRDSAGVRAAIVADIEDAARNIATRLD
jgi:DNA-binding GntR family transcriptional regulator